VIQARARQRARGQALNAELRDSEAVRVAALGAAEWAFYRRLVESTALSARGCRRLLRVSRTLADLQGDGRVGEMHLSEALAFRMSGDQP
jgi:magnesium chelatase family protein